MRILTTERIGLFLAVFYGGFYFVALFSGIMTSFRAELLLTALLFALLSVRSILQDMRSLMAGNAPHGARGRTIEKQAPDDHAA